MIIAEAAGTLLNEPASMRKQEAPLTSQALARRCACSQWRYNQAVTSAGKHLTTAGVMLEPRVTQHTALLIAADFNSISGKAPEYAFRSTARAPPLGSRESRDLAHEGRPVGWSPAKPAAPAIADRRDGRWASQLQGRCPATTGVTGHRTWR